MGDGGEVQDRFRGVQKPPKLLQRTSKTDTRRQYDSMERKTVLAKTGKTTKYVQETKEHERIYRQTNSGENQQLRDWLLPILTHEIRHARGSRYIRQT